MKKWIAMLCAALLCASCLALASCGGSSGSASAGGSGSAAESASAGGSGSAAESASAESAAAPEQPASFVGDWKLAGIDMNGVTIVGDMGSILGAEAGFKLSLQDGGTGSMSYGENSANLTWTQKDASTLAVLFEKPESGDSSSSEGAEQASDPSNAFNTSEDGSIDFTYADGVLSTEMKTDEQTGTLMFTLDGKLPGIEEIDLSKATPITSKDALVGDWKLSGANVMGMTVCGESDAIAEMANGADLSLSFKEDGTCVVSGEEVPYTVSADGASIEQGGMKIPLLSLGDGIVMDVGSLLGMEMAMVYSR